MDNRFQLDLTAMLHRLPRVYIELLIVSTHSQWCAMAVVAALGSAWCCHFTCATEFGVSAAALQCLSTISSVHNWESVAGSVIQATGTVKFEDGLRTGVLPEGH